MNLFFDTETSGLFEKDWQWNLDYKLFPYVLSICWKYNNKIHYYLIHQEGRAVPKEATQINGITTEMVNGKLAKPAKEVYKLFIADALKAATIIGHNTYFDTAMVKSNVYKNFGPRAEERRLIEEGLHKDKRIDTMRSTVKLFGKWPTLTQLHVYLFGKEFKAHDNMEDVLATERCYNELVKRKII